MSEGMSSGVFFMSADRIFKIRHLNQSESSKLVLGWLVQDLVVSPSSVTSAMKRSIHVLKLLHVSMKMMDLLVPAPMVSVVMTLLNAMTLMNVLMLPSITETQKMTLC